jgi:hypothetical protein
MPAACSAPVEETAMDQKLIIITANGTLGLRGSAVVDNAPKPGLFVLRSTGTAPINYGDVVTLLIRPRRVEVDPSTSRLRAVAVVPTPPQPGPSTSKFTLRPIPGNAVAAFGAGSEFALLSDYGCLRCRNGYVQAGGAVDTDAPARLRAKF